MIVVAGAISWMWKTGTEVSPVELTLQLNVEHMMNALELLRLCCAILFIKWSNSRIGNYSCAYMSSLVHVSSNVCCAFIICNVQGHTLYSYYWPWLMYLLNLQIKYKQRH